MQAIVISSRMQFSEIVTLGHREDDPEIDTSYTSSLRNTVPFLFFKGACVEEIVIPLFEVIAIGS